MSDAGAWRRRAGHAGIAAACILLLTGACLGQTAPALERDPLNDLPSYGQSLVRMVISLLAIIVGLVVVARLLSRWMAGRTFQGRGKIIQVVERQQLEPRKAVYLIRVAGQYILVGSSDGQLQTLAGGPLDQERVAAALERSTGREADSAASDTLGDGNLVAGAAADKSV